MTMCRFVDVKAYVINRWVFYPVGYEFFGKDKKKTRNHQEKNDILFCKINQEFCVGVIFLLYLCKKEC